MQMSLCLVHSCLLVSLSEPPELLLGPAGCLHCFGNAAGQLGSRTHTATLTPHPSHPKTLLFPFSFCTAATSRHSTGNPQRPTEWSSVACRSRSRSRHSVRSPECRDDGARPFILIYYQICGVDQLGMGAGGLTPLRHIRANLSRLICLLRGTLLYAWDMSVLVCIDLLIICV